MTSSFNFTATPPTGNPVKINKTSTTATSGTIVFRGDLAALTYINNITTRYVPTNAEQNSSSSTVPFPQNFRLTDETPCPNFNFAIVNLLHHLQFHEMALLNGNCYNSMVAINLNNIAVYLVILFYITIIYMPLNGQRARDSGKLIRGLDIGSGNAAGLPPTVGKSESIRLYIRRGVTI